MIAELATLDGLALDCHLFSNGGLVLSQRRCDLFVQIVELLKQEFVSGFEVQKDIAVRGLVFHGRILG